MTNISKFSFAYSILLLINKNGNLLSNRLIKSKFKHHKRIIKMIKFFDAKKIILNRNSKQ